MKSYSSVQETARRWGIRLIDLLPNSFSIAKNWNISDHDKRVKDGSIPGDRQKYLLETLRTLKKGGTFALHDIFSKSKYGDMQAFVKKLRDMGYEKVELIYTTNDKFMKKSETSWMALSGSTMLTGRK